MMTTTTTTTTAPAFVSGAAVSAFTPTRVYSSTSPLRPVRPRPAAVRHVGVRVGDAPRRTLVRAAAAEGEGSDEKFVEPQAGDPDFEQPPTVSEQGLNKKAAGDGTSRDVKAENVTAGMDPDSWKPADSSDSDASTGVKVPELEKEADK